MGRLLRASTLRMLGRQRVSDVVMITSYRIGPWRSAHLKNHIDTDAGLCASRQTSGLQETSSAAQLRACGSAACPGGARPSGFF